MTQFFDQHPFCARLLFAFLLLFAASFAHGQGAPGPSNYPVSRQTQSGAPGGTCPGTNVLDIDIATPNLYYCPVAGGSWQVGAGGGSPGGSTDALQYNAGSSTFGGLNSPTTDCVYNVIFNVTGSAAVAPTAACPGMVPNPQTGTTYTYLYSDRGGYTTASNASAQAYTLPQAGSTGFANNWYNFTCNIGAGTATITPTTSTISYTTGSAYTSGALTLALTTGQCASIKSDNTNYFANVFAAGSSAAGPTFTGTYWVPLYVFPGSATASATSLFNANEPQVFGFNCCVPGGGAAESTTLWIYVSTGQSAATCDAGLYGPITSSSTTASLALHTGSFACATSSLYLSQAVAGGPVTTPPGFYLEAVCSSNSGVTFGAAGVQAGWVGSGNALAKVAGHDAAGGSEACTSGVLPSSITLVNITADGKYAPIMTMTN